MRPDRHSAGREISCGGVNVRAGRGRASDLSPLGFPLAYRIANELAHPAAHAMLELPDQQAARRFASRLPAEIALPPSPRKIARAGRRHSSRRSPKMSGILHPTRNSWRLPQVVFPIAARLSLTHSKIDIPIGGEFVSARRRHGDVSATISLKANN